MVCTNFGFRPKKSTWSALENIKIRSHAPNFGIEGDIASAYNTVDHDILLKILAKRIKDKHFLKLIHNLLKSGVMDHNRLEHNLSGVPQGGIVSPLLFNIDMFELDKYVYNHIIKVHTSSKPTETNKDYSNIRLKIGKAKRRKAKTTNKEEKRQLKKQIKGYVKQRLQMSSKVNETKPYCIVYTRYADDWLILVKGPLELTLEIKQKISEFIKSNLKIELDPEKTLVTHTSKPIYFIGFTIQVPTNVKITRLASKNTRYLRRTTRKTLYIYPDRKRVLYTNLTLRKFCEQRNKLYYPIAKPGFIVLSDYEIVLKYRQIMIGFFNYYRNVDRLNFLNYVFYILQYSCAKTLARKKRISIRKIFFRHTFRLKITTKTYKNKKLINKTIQLPSFQELKSGKIKGTPSDTEPFNIQQFWRTSFKLYLDCCICGNTENIAMHHLNSLSNLKSKKDSHQVIRSQLKRKQIPVCEVCHLRITNGEFDSPESLNDLYNNYIATL